MGNAQRRKKLGVYPSHDVYAQALELEADKVFESFGLPFSELKDCYGSIFLDQSLFARSVWDLWEYCPFSSHGFNVYQEGHTKSEYNGLFFLRNSEYSRTCKTFNVAKSKSFHQAFSSGLRDPSKLMLHKCPPPTLVVLHDGLPGGSFVSQWCVAKETL